MRVYRDTDYDMIITEEELEKEYHHLVEIGGTEATTFTEYIINCTDKNGTLELIK